MPLNSLIVKHAKASGKPFKLTDEAGLYLLVTAQGSKLWRFDYRYERKRKTLAFGKWPKVELATARKMRDEAREALSSGLDPGAPPEGVPSSNMFETVGRNWYAASKHAWTKRYALLVLGRLEADIFLHMGKEDIDTIEAPRLLDVIRKIEARGALEMAKRVRNHCSEIFQFGIAEGKCRRDPALEIVKAMQKARPKKHHAMLPPREVPELVAKIGRYEGEEQTKLALQFTLITMVRTQETRFAHRNEFENLGTDEALWRLSPERMKMDREHLVPLPRQAVAIIRRLKQLSPDSEYLFPCNTRVGVISENTMLYALYRLGYHSRQTTHGLRRIASTFLNETGLFEPDWVETKLAHMDKNKVRGAYNAAIYLKHRRTMLQWWADRLDEMSNTLQIAA